MITVDTGERAPTHTKETGMDIEQEAQADLPLDTEAAEQVVGGRRTKKTSASKASAAQAAVVVAPPTAPAQETPEAALPVLGDDECLPIHYGETD
jgi:hypothetical protein